MWNDTLHLFKTVFLNIDVYYSTLIQSLPLTPMYCRIYLFVKKKTFNNCGASAMWQVYWLYLCPRRMSIFGDCSGGCLSRALTICQVCYYALYKVYLSQTTTISSISGQESIRETEPIINLCMTIAGTRPYTIVRAGCLHIWCWSMKPSGSAVRKGRWIWTEGEKEWTKAHKNGLKPCQVFASDLVLGGALSWK